MVKRQRQPTSKWAWTTVIIVLIVLAFFSMIIAGIIGVIVGAGSDSIQKTNGLGNVAVIGIEGPIVTTKLPGFTTKSAVSGEIVRLIEKADKDKQIKGIVLSINTPGGSAVASDEISTALKATKKPTVALIRDIGTSGGYWVAVSTDHIVAHPASLTVSIGVIGSHLGFSGLIEDYNITYRRFVSGENKDMVNPFREMTDDQRALFQETIDELHEIFVDHVAEDRNMPRQKVAQIATGAFMSGKKAYKLGLIDELGGKKEVKAYLEKNLNTTVKFVSYKKPKTFVEALMSSMSDHGYQVGKGLGSSMVEQEQQPGVFI